MQQDHLDVDLQALEPYTPKYALWRTREGYGTAVDLTLTGGMFAALTHQVSAEQVEIFFAPGSSRSVRGGTSKTTNPEKAFFLQEKREFFGITIDDVDNIFDLYNIYIGDVLSGNQ